MINHPMLRYKESFGDDGSLFDIYILGTQLRDWQSMLELLRTSSYSLEFTVDSEARSLPESAKDIFDLSSENSVTLSIDTGNLNINCHFFVQDSIELDIDPRDYKSPEKIALLLHFLHTISSLLQKPVIMTPENTPDSPFYRFDPLARTEEWLEEESA